MNNNEQVVNVRVEFEATPIRHVAIQCPYCQKWFYGHDVTQPKEWLSYDYQLKTFTYTCPICKKDFGHIYNSDPWNHVHCKINIQEVGSAEDCYKDCVEKKVTWE